MTYTLAWTVTRRTLRLYPALISASAVGLMLLTHMPARAAEIVVPLAAGLQAAFIFAPEDEPVLELVLSAPRPALWLLGERLLWVFWLHGAVGLVGGLVGAAIGRVDVLTTLLAWLAPFVYLMGIGMFLTLIMGRAAYGALSVILLFIGWLFFGDALVVTVPELASLHLYLPRAWDMLRLGGWALNRAFLISAGVALMLACSLWVRDAENVMSSAY